MTILIGIHICLIHPYGTLQIERLVAMGFGIYLGSEL